MQNFILDIQPVRKEKKYEDRGLIQWRYYFNDKQTGNTYFYHITENLQIKDQGRFKGVCVYHIHNDECRFCQRHGIEKSTCDGLFPKYNRDLLKFFLSDQVQSTLNTD